MVRGRARDLCMNNDYARRFLLLCRNNIVGPDGFKFEANVKDPNGASDRYANLKIQAAWDEWCRAANCTITGKLSFRGVQDILVRHLARDGEILVKKVLDREGLYPLKLQILDPDLLDETYNDRLPNGNHVVMGVELDRNRRPVAYHILDDSNHSINFSVYANRQRTRYMAEDIYHIFDPDRAFQTRGISWMAPSMYRLKMLTGYEEAALVNARLSATIGGYFYSEDGTTLPGDGKDDQGNIITTFEPGEYKQLPAGLKVQNVDPNYPDQQHDMFVKAILRGVASGFGVSYATLANDLTQVNYSSIRAGLLDERDNWRAWQRVFAEQFLEPVYSDWLDLALLGDRLNLPAAKFEKFNRPVFTGRRWAWVDPKNDIEAELASINGGLKSRTMSLAERGENIEEIFQELAEEKAAAEALGLKFDTKGATTNGSAKQGTSGEPGDPGDPNEPSEPGDEGDGGEGSQGDQGGRAGENILPLGSGFPGGHRHKRQNGRVSVLK